MLSSNVEATIFADTHSPDSLLFLYQSWSMDCALLLTYPGYGAESTCGRAALFRVH
jgi:hypothetical protein